MRKQLFFLNTLALACRQIPAAAINAPLSPGQTTARRGAMQTGQQFGPASTYISMMEPSSTIQYSPKFSNCPATGALASINCGNKALKNSKSFGLPSPTIKPLRNSVQKVVVSVGSARLLAHGIGNLEASDLHTRRSCLALRQVLMPK